MTLEKVLCPECGKQVKRSGLGIHYTLKHKGLEKPNPKELPNEKAQARHNNAKADSADTAATAAISFATGRCEEAIREIASKSGLPFDVIASGVATYFHTYRRRSS